MIKRIILHWSAGTHFPNTYEKKCYHYLIDCNGKVHIGEYTPSDNEDCTDGHYAMHTGGGNTGSIGVCFCSMLGYKSPKFAGNYPITKVQFESGMKLCAELCKKYRLEISAKTIMTHYEFGKENPQTISAGKIDITYLPPYPWVAKEDVGSFIRTKVRWYKEKL